MTGTPKCIKCNARAKHDPVGGVMTTCGRHSAAHAERAAERMRKLHANPEFAAANAERMRKLHANPEFAAANAERMRKLNADPEFAAANAERAAERMRKLNADPEFAAANAERAAERMRKLHANPDHNPLVMLTTQERADYDTFKRNGYSRDDAFRAIGRADLIRPEAAE